MSSFKNDKHKTISTPNFLFQLESSELRLFQDSLSSLKQSAVIISYFEAQRKFIRMNLSKGGSHIRDMPNAGGNSIRSEAMSYEVLYHLLNANLVNTETELTYDVAKTKLTDYTITLPSVSYRIAVSVSRAFHCINDSDFTVEDALYLLEKKLIGAIESSENIQTDCNWRRHIVHVWVPSIKVAQILSLVFRYDIRSDLRSNTILLITVASTKKDRFLYTEGSLFLADNLVLSDRSVISKN
eukprot:gb/GECH01012199.1/.p1 GENE.gb/GECH01012199.1/~~gb/GECH01012199.1/.p1  ORF type:complete len:241 (+),score=37.56 gb/GECH01012199.1/:1-723(+)